MRVLSATAAWACYWQYGSIKSTLPAVVQYSFTAVSNWGGECVCACEFTTNSFVLLLRTLLSTAASLITFLLQIHHLLALIPIHVGSTHNAQHTCCAPPDSLSSLFIFGLPERKLLSLCDI